MNWLLQGILRFGSSLLVLTVVACGGSGSRLLVLTPSQPPSEVVPQPDPTSQANFEKLVASWPTALLDGGVFVIPAGRFVFPAGLARLSLIVQRPGVPDRTLGFLPTELGCNLEGTICDFPELSISLVGEDGPSLARGLGRQSSSVTLVVVIVDRQGAVYSNRIEVDLDPSPSPSPTPTPEPSASPSPSPSPSPLPDPGTAGFGSAPAPNSTITVGSALIGESTAETFTISETGTLKLEVGAGSITGTHVGDFNIAPDSAFAIADGGSPQDVTITCTPTGLGSRTATLEFATNDPNKPTVSYDLECEGLAVPVSIFGSKPTPGAPIDLGSAIINTATGSQTLSISNTGTAKLELGAAQRSGKNPGDFTISPNTAFGIEVSGSQDVTITCTPGDLGERTATLEFTTNDPNNATVSYDLECEGLPPAPSLVVNTLVDENGTNPNKCSLREAITANNTSADFGGCAIPPSGTITFDAALTGGTIMITNSFLPQITRNVVIDGLGANNLTISGEKQFNIFNIDSAGSPAVTIKEITLTQGSFAGAGGAIRHLSAGVLTIEDAVISESTAQQQGGAIRSIGEVQITNSTLSGNSAGSGGGGIYSDSVVNVTNSIFRNNAAAASTLAGNGGAIAAGEVHVTDSTFENNSAYAGGGIRSSTVTIENSTLSQNTAVSGDGGGVASGGTVTLNQVTLDGNYAGDRGGGIYAITANVTDSTLSGNKAVGASGFGGAIYAITADVSDSTLSNNTAGTRGGGIRAGTTAIVSNSTLSGNSAGARGGGIYGNAAINNSILLNNTASINGGGVSGTRMTVSNSTLSGNSARYGGAISSSGTATVSNSTLSNNTAGVSGGGFRAGTAIVSNSTLSGNNASGEGGGIFASFVATVRNSTFYDNRSVGRGNSINFVSGTFVNNLVVSDSSSGTSEVAAGGNSAQIIIRHNVIRALDNIGVDVSSTGASNVVVTDNNFTILGTVVSVVNNGSGASTNISPNTTDSNSPLQPTNEFLDTSLAVNNTTVLAGDPNAGQQPVLTHALVPGSPALGAGDEDICEAAPINDLDQRGERRPQGDPICDVGAFESDDI